MLRRWRVERYWLQHRQRMFNRERRAAQKWNSNDGGYGPTGLRLKIDKNPHGGGIFACALVLFVSPDLNSSYALRASFKYHRLREDARGAHMRHDHDSWNGTLLTLAHYETLALFPLPCSFTFHKRDLRPARREEEKNWLCNSLRGTWDSHMHCWIPQQHLFRFAICVFFSVIHEIKDERRKRRRKAQHRSRWNDETSCSPADGEFFHCAQTQRAHNTHSLMAWSLARGPQQPSQGARRRRRSQLKIDKYHLAI